MNVNYLDGFEDKFEASLITKMVPLKSSSGLSLGRRPMSKSGEFFEGTIVLIKLQRLEVQAVFTPMLRFIGTRLFFGVGVLKLIYESVDGVPGGADEIAASFGECGGAVCVEAKDDFCDGWRDCSS